jgi:hypothetical protein
MYEAKVKRVEKECAIVDDRKIKRMREGWRGEDMLVLLLLKKEKGGTKKTRTVGTQEKLWSYTKLFLNACGQGIAVAEGYTGAGEGDSVAGWA